MININFNINFTKNHIKFKKNIKNYKNNHYNSNICEINILNKYLIFLYKKYDHFIFE